MKISPILILKGTVLAWDGPWDGVNVLTDDVLQSNDLMELNRDPKLIHRVPISTSQGTLLTHRLTVSTGFH